MFLKKNLFERSLNLRLYSFNHYFQTSFQKVTILHPEMNFRLHFILRCPCYSVIIHLSTE